MNSAVSVSARFGSMAVIRAAAAFLPPRSDATAFVAPPDSFRAASGLVAFGVITRTMKSRTCGHRKVRRPAFIFIVYTAVIGLVT